MWGCCGGFQCGFVVVAVDFFVGKVHGGGGGGRLPWWWPGGGVNDVGG